MGLQTWAHWTSGKAGYNVSNNVIRGDFTSSSELLGQGNLVWDVGLGLPFSSEYSLERWAMFG